MLRTISPLANLGLFVVAMVIIGAAPQAPLAPTAPVVEADLGIQPGDSPTVDLSSPAETLSCNVEQPTTDGWPNPPLSCQCWQGCCENFSCWRGYHLEFCGPK